MATSRASCMRAERPARLGVEAAAANKCAEHTGAVAQLRAAGREIPAPFGHQRLVAQLFLRRQIDIDPPLAIGGDVLLRRKFFGVAL